MTRMLAHPRLWQTLGLVWVAIVLFACLTPHVPKLGPHDTDKVLHFLAFCALAGWFGAVTRYRWHVLVVMGLVALGGVIEYLQGFTGRDPSVWDWMADSLGVLIGIALSKSIGLPIVRFVEARLFVDD